MISAVLFDLDDTLSDRLAAAHDFLGVQFRRRNLADFGIQCGDFISAYFELEREGFLQKAKLFPILVERLNLPGAMADQLFQDFQAIYPYMARPQANALECLASLQQDGIRCAVISNGEAVVQRPKLDALGLMPFLEFSLISSEVGIRKPNRKIFELAASKLMLEVDKCMFVGDNPVADVAGAENAGMHAVFFGDPVSWPSDLSQPTHHCTSLVDIPLLVAKFNNSDVNPNDAFRFAHDDERPSWGRYQTGSFGGG